MPCYLFTFHAYGSWLPDRPQGYVKRGRGILSTDHRMAAIYAENLKSRVVVFDERIQRLLIESARESIERQSCRCHQIATDASHAHILASWQSDRTWELVRKQIGHSMTRRLNAELGRRQWFAKSPSRRRVEDRKHFDHLTTVYLPRHKGLKWSASNGVFL
jgi:hypothetical protein